MERWMSSRGAQLKSTKDGIIQAAKQLAFKHSCLEKVEVMDFTNIATKMTASKKTLRKMMLSQTVKSGTRSSHCSRVWK